TLSEFIRLLESHARAAGAVELFFDSFAYRGGALELEQAGFDLARRFEFELDLRRSEEDLWEGMEYKRAKNIKKAMRSGVFIRNLPGDVGLAELRRLQSESGQRIVERGGPDITYRRRDQSDPVETLLNSGCARIMGAEVEGEIVSAGLFTNFNGLVYYNLSGHSRRAMQTQAGTLMLWETIKQYRQEGASRFNFGGCKFDAVNEDSPEHGVYVYKKAFGATCLECASGQKILRPAARKVVGTLKTVLGRAD
ncbi:MAG TPA: peptidoglycan bridge formation glycyltransferase FemA/FemB family protein, partial [Pyrinomonadaceae bacterium]|nr:peptidoglycan bridge formation glycyltransferase FemA/FemB family protein [Pyrinomonadaceae bacterium]